MIKHTLKKEDGMVRARDVFLTALELRDLTILDFAKANGLSSPNIRQKINGNETLRATEFFYLLGLLDIDCEFYTHSANNESDVSDYILGHFSAGFTLDTYAHVTTGMQQDAANKVGDFLKANI